MNSNDPLLDAWFKHNHSTKQPPLGLRPENIAIKQFNQDRVMEILEAMDRYSNAQKACPQAWLEELKFRINEI